MDTDAVRTHHANCGKKRVRTRPVMYDAGPASGKIRKIDPCVMCLVDTEEGVDTTILCDGCDGAYHLKCLDVEEVPKDDWYSDKCHRNENVPISHMKEKIGA
jgi:hypothetical protein